MKTLVFFLVSLSTSATFAYEFKCYPKVETAPFASVDASLDPVESNIAHFLLKVESGDGANNYVRRDGWWMEFTSKSGLTTYDLSFLDTEQKQEFALRFKVGPKFNSNQVIKTVLENKTTHQKHVYRCIRL